MNHLAFNFYFIYDANRTKLRKYFYEDNRLIETTDYSGMFIYKDDHLDNILTSEGRMKWDDHDSLFYAEYFIKDHLGNVRTVLTTDPSFDTIVQQTDYYPFGLEIAVSGTSDNQIKYNSKELQTDAKFDWYDYGARFYDPVLGRWHVVDPMAETSRRWSPYTYCMNNPIRFIDPDGMEITDYTFNKKSGEVAQVGAANKEPDRILKTNSKNEIKFKKNGEAKVSIDGIEKGILNDGQNFKTEDNIISVGGENQPTLEGVEDFVTKIGEYIGAEMAGTYLSTNDGADAAISKVYIDEYKGNTSTRAYISLTKLYADESINGMKTTTQFHTHITNLGVIRSNVENPSEADKEFKRYNQSYFKNFIILTRTTGYPTSVLRIKY